MDAEDCLSLQPLALAEYDSLLDFREMPTSRSPSQSSYTKTSDDEDIKPIPSFLASPSHSMTPIPSHHQSYPASLSTHFSHQNAFHSPPLRPKSHALSIPTDPISTAYISGSNPSPQNPDLFYHLRKFNIATTTAWTVIPASEGFKAVDTCKSLSSTGSGTGEGSRVPCYNRETIYDEEWQRHMKDVHGVFLLWPETWMKRIEVLDLESCGGDIEGCNDLIMG